jgi:hypothetical protein
MTRLKSGILATLAITVLVVLVAQAQTFGRFRGQNITQNQPPSTELVVARWRYGTNGAVGHMGWAHNYPASDRNLNEFLKRATNLSVEEASFRIVELGSDEVFDYPFAYVSEPGEMELTDQEAVNLHEFIKRGGFVLMDDFDGDWQLEQMRSQVRRVFPEWEMAAVPMDHALFRGSFELNDLQTMSEHVPGGFITYFGLLDDSNRLTIAAGHNNDLANFWEWYNTDSMPLSPGADAFRLGSNAVLYALTH